MIMERALDDFISHRHMRVVASPLFVKPHYTLPSESSRAIHPAGRRRGCVNRLSTARCSTVPVEAYHLCVPFLIPIYMIKSDYSILYITNRRAYDSTPLVRKACIRDDRNAHSQSARVYGFLDTICWSTFINGTTKPILPGQKRNPFSSHRPHDHERFSADGTYPRLACIYY